MHNRLRALGSVARVAVLVLLTAAAAQADEIKVMTSGAMSAALRETDAGVRARVRFHADHRLGRLGCGSSRLDSRSPSTR